MNNTSIFTFLYLPDELIEYILCYLTVDELGFVSLVCKQLSLFIHDNNNLWKICFYNSFSFQVQKINNDLSWKDFSILNLMELTANMKQRSNFIVYYTPIANISVDSDEKHIYMFPIRSFYRGLLNINHYKRAFIWCAMHGYINLLKVMIKSSSNISQLIIINKNYPFGSDIFRGYKDKGNYKIGQSHIDVDYVMRDRKILIKDHPQFPQSSKDLIEKYIKSI